MNNSNEVNSLTVLNAQCRVMDMLLDAVKSSHKEFPSTGRFETAADTLIKETGLVLAMTDDEEYAREEVTKFIGRWN